MGINIIVLGDSLSLPQPFEKDQYNNYSQVLTGIINNFEGIDSVINLTKSAAASLKLYKKLGFKISSTEKITDHN